MANTSQAEKRVRQNKKREEHNVAQRTAVRTIVKKTLKLIQGKDEKAAQSGFQEASSFIDKVAGRRVITHNRAARLKSRLHQKLKTIAQ